jgi:hypothetical protein
MMKRLIFSVLALVAFTLPAVATSHQLVHLGGTVPAVVHRADQFELTQTIETELYIPMEQTVAAGTSVETVGSAAQPAGTAAESNRTEVAEVKTVQQSTSQSDIQAPLREKYYKYGAMGLAIVGFILGIVGVAITSNPLMLIGLLICAGALTVFFLNPKNRKVHK